MSPFLSSRRNSSRALLGVRSVDASGCPSWVIVCMQSARAARTAEKVWFRSGGTSREALALFRLGREAEGHPGLGDRLLRLGDGGCRDPQLLLTTGRNPHG